MNLHINKIYKTENLQPFKELSALKMPEFSILPTYTPDLVKKFNSIKRIFTFYIITDCSTILTRNAIADYSGSSEEFASCMLRYVYTLTPAFTVKIKRVKYTFNYFFNFRSLT